MAQPAGQSPKAFIRLFLTLSSVMMFGLALLTLTGVLGLQPFIGWLFAAVGLIDLVIGYVAFRD